MKNKSSQIKFQYFILGVWLGLGMAIRSNRSPVASRWNDFYFHVFELLLSSRFTISVRSENI